MRGMRFRCAVQAVLASSAWAARSVTPTVHEQGNPHLAVLKERWLARTDRTGGVWSAALTNWSTAARRERKDRGADGKYLVAFADDYGLGNRINIVTSTLALAMATGRALVILWPRTDCHHTNHGDCDPTSIDDLFVENATKANWGVGSHAHAAISRCRDDIKRHSRPLKRWALGDREDRKTADHLRTHPLDASWRSEDPVVCTYGYFYWGWALTCNRYLRRRWGLDQRGNPWAEFGGLVNYLLGDIRYGIVNRIHQVLQKGTCDVGLHLRRADTLSADGKHAAATEKYKARLEEALAGLEHPNVYIAADHESKKTKWMLLHYLQERPNAHLLTLGHGHVADRQSTSGIDDALAENFVLSSCATLIPRGTGASTFHDVAVVCFRVRKYNWHRPSPTCSLVQEAAPNTSIRAGTRCIPTALERVARRGVRIPRQGPARAADD